MSTQPKTHGPRHSYWPGSGQMSGRPPLPSLPPVVGRFPPLPWVVPPVLPPEPSIGSAPLQETVTIEASWVPPSINAPKNHAFLFMVTLVPTALGNVRWLEQRKC